MSLQKNNQKKICLRKVRRQKRVRSRQKSRGVIPRVCVFRSLKNIYAQIIDDSNQKVILSHSSLKLAKDKNTDKKTVAKKIGLELGRKAIEKSIKKAFFDRGNCLYHGRVKELVEGLREGGLQI